MKLLLNKINPNKLHDELIKENIIPLLVEHDLKNGEYMAENTIIIFNDNENMDKINEIVNNHNPIPLPLKPTQENYLLDLDFRLSKIELGV